MADINKITYVSMSKLGYYDEKLKQYIQVKDEALQSNIDSANAAIEAEVIRAKAAESTNAAAAQAAQEDVDALAGKVGVVPEGSTVMGIITNIQENAYDDTEIRNLISGLDSAKADKTQVATDIETAVNAEKTAREQAVTGVQGALDELSGTVSANKSAIESTVATLEEKVNANETDIEGKMTALTERVAANETAVGTTLPNAINAEKEAREAAVAELAADIKEVSDDYLKAADKTELEGKITANTNALSTLNGEGEGSVKKAIDDAINKFATDVTNDDVVNSYKELIDWAAEHGGEAAEMAAAIEANETAIGELETFIGSLPEGATVSTVVAYIEKLVADEAARAGQAEGDLSDRLDAVEDMLGSGEGSVADQIADAADAAKEAAIAAAAADATEKANTAEANAKSHADGLNTAMNTRVVALEEIDHEAYKGADATLKSELEGKIDLKADNTALAQEIQDRKDADDALKTEVKGYAKDYADGLNATMDGRMSAVEAASATHALASDLTALAGRVTTAEGKVSTLETEMDAVEALAAANKAAHEANAAAIALKASQAALTEEINRAKAAEQNLQDQLNAFEECTTNDIDGLFA